MAANPINKASKKKFQRSLTQAQQVFITVRMATWTPPIEIIAEFKEEFGREITKQACQRYDPNKYNGRSMSAKLRAVFEEARTLYLKDSSSIAIANKIWRLQELQTLYGIARDKGNLNFKLLMEILEHAAKEVGEAFSARAKPDDKPPGDMEQEDTVVLRPDEPIPEKPVL